jgi:hypothetical protein
LLRYLFCTKKLIEWLTGFWLLVNKVYNLFGISDVVSKQKGLGFGKLILQKMKEYSESTNKTLIGICERENSDFYMKSGFKVIPNHAELFLIPDMNGQKVSYKGDLVYVERSDMFITHVVENKQAIFDKVYLPYLPW